MFSPTLGRWTQNDPIGFAAGDVNLYRTLMNTLANLLDPYGLGPLKYPISATLQYDQGFTTSEQSDVSLAWLNTLESLKKAEYILANRWDLIQQKGITGKSAYTGEDIKTPSYKVLSHVVVKYVAAGTGARGYPEYHPDEVKNEYLDRIRKAIALIEKGDITCERDKGKQEYSRPAHVNTWWLTGSAVSNTIHVTNDFWAKHRAGIAHADTMKHEVGRLVGFGGKDGTGNYYYDVYVWDGVTDFLIGIYDDKYSK